MPHLHRSLRRALAAAAGTVLVVGVLTSAAAAQPPGGAVTARVYLAGQDPAGLTAYVNAVSTPGNARYGRYLTAAQVMSRYGPTKAEVSAVMGWLYDHSLSGLVLFSVLAQAASLPFLLALNRPQPSTTKE